MDQANGKHKKARVAIFLSGKVEFRKKSITIDKEGYP